jgi:outer membrane protein OmpA-like peptidoglycan-associated protein
MRNVANTGTVEIGVMLKRLVKKTVKKKDSDGVTNGVQASNAKTGKKLGASVGVKKPATSPVRPSGDTTKVSPSPKVDMSDRLRQKQDSVVARANAGDISHEPLILEKATLYFNFEFNSAELDAGSKDYLDELAIALLDNPELKLKLVGHTDNTGSAKFNLKLSLERARSLKQYLLMKGVGTERISVDGKGMTEPLNGNETEGEKAKNRRVELTILYDH